MISVEKKIEVKVSDEMLDAIQDTLKGLDELQDVMYEYGLSFQTPGSNWFDCEDVFKTKDLLATLVHPDCYFEE